MYIEGYDTYTININTNLQRNIIILSCSMEVKGTYINFLVPQNNLNSHKFILKGEGATRAKRKKRDHVRICICYWLNSLYDVNELR